MALFQPKTWVYLTLTLAIFGVVSLLVGIFTPLWVYLSCDGVTVAVGLVYRSEQGCTVDSDDNCVNAPDSFNNVKYNTPDTQDKDHWGAVAGLEMGGTAMGIVTLLLFVIYTAYFRSKKDLNCFNLVLMAASIVTWVTVGVGLIIFAMYHGDAFTDGPQHVSTESFPWSALICFMGAIIMVFVSILIRTRCRQEDFINHPVPASIDSKQGLYPSSQNGFGSRYFAPHLFRDEQKLGYYGPPTALPLAAPPSPGRYNRSFEPEQIQTPYDNPQQDQRIVLTEMLQPVQQEQRRIVTTEVLQPVQQEQRRIVATEEVQPVQQEQRRITTEVVLGRRGAGQDVDYDRENKDLVIYKGRDNVRRLEDVGNGFEGRSSFISSTERRLPQQTEYHMGASQFAHADPPSKVVSSSAFTDADTKFNQTYAYRPYSEHVY